MSAAFEAAEADDFLVTTGSRPLSLLQVMAICKKGKGWMGLPHMCSVVDRFVEKPDLEKPVSTLMREIILECGYVCLETFGHPQGAFMHAPGLSGLDELKGTWRETEH